MHMSFSTEGAEHLGIISVKSNFLNHWFSSLVVNVVDLKDKNVSGPTLKGCDISDLGVT